MAPMHKKGIGRDTRLQEAYNEAQATFQQIKNLYEAHIRTEAQIQSLDEVINNLPDQENQIREVKDLLGNPDIHRPDPLWDQETINEMANTLSDTYRELFTDLLETKKYEFSKDMEEYTIFSPRFSKDLLNHILGEYIINKYQVQLYIEISNCLVSATMGFSLDGSSTKYTFMVWYGGTEFNDDPDLITEDPIHFLTALGEPK